MTRYISEKGFQKELEQIQKENVVRERKRKLREERFKTFPKFKLPSTSKIVLFIAVLICVEILAFTEFVTVKLNDTSALYALVGIPAVLAPTIIAYYMKSKAENTKGGIVYDKAMMQNEIEDTSTETVDEIKPSTLDTKSE